MVFKARCVYLGSEDYRHEAGQLTELGALCRSEGVRGKPLSKVGGDLDVGHVKVLRWREQSCMPW